MSESEPKAPWPQPDLMDQGGRLRRLVLALLIGAAAGAAAFFIADSMAKPDALVGKHPASGAYKFVFYMTAFAGSVAFAIALVVQNKIADKKYRDGLVAKAQLKKP